MKPTRSAFFIADIHCERCSSVIRRRINELGERYRIREIAIDRWNATQLASQLEGDGFEMVAFSQGYASMSAPTKKLDEVVLSAKLAHGGHPVLSGWRAM